MNQYLQGVSILIMTFLLGCGSASPQPEMAPGPEVSDDTVGAEPKSDSRLLDAEYTTEVDTSSLTAAAPVSTEFLPDAPEIFFLGKLSGIPADSEIEVRWSRSTQGKSFHTTRATGSGNYTVLSRFSPQKEPLSDGQYWTIVSVNGKEVGKRSFRIVDRRSGGVVSVKQLKVSLAVDEKNNAVSASNSLPKGVKKIHASFYVLGVEEGATIRVKWYRDEDDLIDEADIESFGEKRYSTPLQRNKSLAIGDYVVEVEILGEVFARRSFYVGDSSGRPVIDQAALGTALGKDQMPKRAKTAFKQGTRQINCGVQFAFVPENSAVEVSWVSLAGGSEDVLHISHVSIKKSGTSAIGVGWKPKKKLPQGPYKAVVSVNNVAYKEIPFVIE